MYPLIIPLFLEKSKKYLTSEICFWIISGRRSLTRSSLHILENLMCIHVGMEANYGRKCRMGIAHKIHIPYDGAYSGMTQGGNCRGSAETICLTPAVEITNNPIEAAKDEPAVIQFHGSVKSPARWECILPSDGPRPLCSRDLISRFPPGQTPR